VFPENIAVNCFRLFFMSSIDWHSEIIAALLNDGRCPKSGAQILKPESMKGETAYNDAQPSSTLTIARAQRFLRIKFHNSPILAARASRRRNHPERTISQMYSHHHLTRVKAGVSQVIIIYIPPKPEETLDQSGGQGFPINSGGQTRNAASVLSSPLRYCRS
jgi:hypothetical protein